MPDERGPRSDQTCQGPLRPNLIASVSGLPSLACIVHHQDEDRTAVRAPNVGRDAAPGRPSAGCAARPPPRSRCPGGSSAAGRQRPARRRRARARCEAVRPSPRQGPTVESRRFPASATARRLLRSSGGENGDNQHCTWACAWAVCRCGAALPDGASTVRQQVFGQPRDAKPRLCFLSSARGRRPTTSEASWKSPACFDVRVFPLRIVTDVSIRIVSSLTSPDRVR
jgi:hypothetical protein